MFTDAEIGYLTDAKNWDISELVRLDATGLFRERWTNFSCFPDNKLKIFVEGNCLVLKFLNDQIKDKFEKQMFVKTNNLNSYSFSLALVDQQGVPEKFLEDFRSALQAGYKKEWKKQNENGSISDDYYSSEYATLIRLDIALRLGSVIDFNTNFLKLGKNKNKKISEYIPENSPANQRFKEGRDLTIVQYFLRYFLPLILQQALNKSNFFGLIYQIFTDLNIQESELKEAYDFLITNHKDLFANQKNADSIAPNVFSTTAQKSIFSDGSDVEYPVIKRLAILCEMNKTIDESKKQCEEEKLSNANIYLLVAYLTSATLAITPEELEAFIKNNKFYWQMSVYQQGPPSLQCKLGNYLIKKCFFSLFNDSLDALSGLGKKLVTNSLISDEIVIEETYFLLQELKTKNFSLDKKKKYLNIICGTFLRVKNIEEKNVKNIIYLISELIKMKDDENIVKLMSRFSSIVEKINHHLEEFLNDKTIGYDDKNNLLLWFLMRSEDKNKKFAYKLKDFLSQCSYINSVSRDFFYNQLFSVSFDDKKNFLVLKISKTNDIRDHSQFQEDLKSFFYEKCSISNNIAVDRESYIVHLSLEDIKKIISVIGVSSSGWGKNVNARLDEASMPTYLKNHYFASPVNDKIVSPAPINLVPKIALGLSSTDLEMICSFLNEADVLGCSSKFFGEATGDDPEIVALRQQQRSYKESHCWQVSAGDKSIYFNSPSHARLTNLSLESGIQDGKLLLGTGPNQQSLGADCPLQIVYDSLQLNIKFFSYASSGHYEIKFENNVYTELLKKAQIYYARKEKHNQQLALENRYKEIKTELHQVITQYLNASGVTVNDNMINIEFNHDIPVGFLVKLNDCPKAVAESLKTFAEEYSFRAQLATLDAMRAVCANYNNQNQQAELKEIINSMWGLAYQIYEQAKNMSNSNSNLMATAIKQIFSQCECFEYLPTASFSEQCDRIIQWIYDRYASLKNKSEKHPSGLSAVTETNRESFAPGLPYSQETKLATTHENSTAFSEYISHRLVINSQTEAPTSPEMIETVSFKVIVNSNVAARFCRRAKFSLEEHNKLQSSTPKVAIPLDFNINQSQFMQDSNTSNIFLIEDGQIKMNMEEFAKNKKQYQGFRTSRLLKRLNSEFSSYVREVNGYPYLLSGIKEKRPQIAAILTGAFHFNDATVDCVYIDGNRAIKASSSDVESLYKIIIPDNTTLQQGDNTKIINAISQKIFSFKPNSVNDVLEIEKKYWQAHPHESLYGKSNAKLNFTPLSHFIEQKTGDCRHLSLMTAYLLAKAAKNNMLVGVSDIHIYRSQSYSENPRGHSVVILKINNKVMLIDSVFNKQFDLTNNSEAAVNFYNSNPADLPGFLDELLIGKEGVKEKLFDEATNKILAMGDNLIEAVAEKIEKDNVEKKAGEKIVPNTECPLSFELIKNPVRVIVKKADGKEEQSSEIFEKSEIEALKQQKQGWIHLTSQEKYSHDNWRFIEDTAAKQLIDETRQAIINEHSQKEVKQQKNKSVNTPVAAVSSENLEAVRKKEQERQEEIRREQPRVQKLTRIEKVSAEILVGIKRANNEVIVHVPNGVTFDDFVDVVRVHLTYQQFFLVSQDSQLYLVPKSKPLCRLQVKWHAQAEQLARNIAEVIVDNHFDNLNMNEVVSAKDINSCWDKEMQRAANYRNKKNDSSDSNGVSPVMDVSTVSHQKFVKKTLNLSEERRLVLIQQGKNGAVQLIFNNADDAASFAAEYFNDSGLLEKQKNNAVLPNKKTVAANQVIRLSKEQYNKLCNSESANNNIKGLQAVLNHRWKLLSGLYKEYDDVINLAENVRADKVDALGKVHDVVNHKNGFKEIGTFLNQISTSSNHTVDGVNVGCLKKHAWLPSFIGYFIKSNSVAAVNTSCKFFKDSPAAKKSGPSSSSKKKNPPTHK